MARLYDLDADPGETKNLAGDHRETVARLTALFLAWHESMPPDLGATYGTKSSGPPNKPNK
jgi:hypothetical protein